MFNLYTPNTSKSHTTQPIACSAALPAILHRKPQAVEFDIALNLQGSSASKSGIRQAIMARLQQSGRSLIYYLCQKPGIHQTYANNRYSLIGEKREQITSQDIPAVLAFVILERTNGYLELRLGLGNHRDVAQNAPTVKAAGDIHFNWDPAHNTLEIVKFTDQSGGYYINPADPRAAAKKASAKAAMQAVGLPMDKFRPFLQPKPLFAPLLRNTTHNAAKSASSTPQATITVADETSALLGLG